MVQLNRSLVVLFYGLAVSLISVNAIITIIYLNVTYTNNPVFIESVRSLTGGFSSSFQAFSVVLTLTVYQFICRNMDS